MHQLSVTGDTDLLAMSVELPVNIKAKIGTETVTFTSDDKAEFEKFKEKLIFPLTNIIETKYKDAIIERELSALRHALTGHELCDVFSDVQRRVDGKNFCIVERLRDFLCESDTLSLEGFVNFRLQDLREDIRRGIDDALSSYIAQKEYAEFTQLLRHFVATQPPAYSELHIIVTRCGGYVICDDMHHDITRECADEIAKSFMADEIGFDDILLSVLLTAAAQKIVFHGAQYIKTPQLVETVKYIFGDSVYFCDGCTLCDSYLNI